MKSIINLILIIVFIAIILAAITNPSKEEFVDYIETQYVQNSSDGILDDAIVLLTKGLVGTIAEQATRTNLVFFSIYEIDEYKYLGVYGNFVRLD